MRYFLELAYNGTRFYGFQKQPQHLSIQEKIESVLQILLREPVEIVGCGRTDTGVHALNYYAHFDYENEFPSDFVKRLNSLLKKDIVVYGCYQVEQDCHARFDAISRTYIYQIDTRNNPFRQETAFFFPYADTIDTDKMEAFAHFLLEIKEFDSFCLSGTDVKTKNCQIFESQWYFNNHQWEYRISANRFLRGMIRLIVGMHLLVGQNKIDLFKIQEDIKSKRLLKGAWSVPPQGLFLTDIIYPYTKQLK